MGSSHSPSSETDNLLRAQLARLVQRIKPWDQLEHSLKAAAEWIASGAPLYRTCKPDIPATHLVSYFVVLNNRTEQR